MAPSSSLNRHDTPFQHAVGTIHTLAERRPTARAVQTRSGHIDQAYRDFLAVI
jgi:hypothetical protein